MAVDIVDLIAKYVSFEKKFDFVIEDATEDLQDGQMLGSDLEIHAGTVVHKDRASTRTKNTCLKTSAQERFKVWDVTLKNLQARLRIPPPGPFDRTNISWEEKINQGQGRSRNTCSAIFPWDMLEDFVVGEHSMRDFPCSFNEVHKLRHKEGMQGEEATEVNLGVKKPWILVVEDECNALVDNVVEFSVIS